MKLLVLNNLASGYGEGAIYDFVRSFAADGDEVCLRSTDGTTELESLITDARDFDAVIASGGDGTVTTTAYSLAGTGIPVMPFPAGTANLLALNLAAPNEPHALAKMLRAGITLDFDMAEIEFPTKPKDIGVISTRALCGKRLLHVLYQQEARSPIQDCLINGIIIILERMNLIIKMI